MWNNVGRHEPWLVRYLPERGLGAVDVGANHGDWTVDMAEVFLHVDAFEPGPAFEKLQIRVEDLDNVDIFPSAVTDVHGEVSFYLFESDVHGTIDIGNFDASRSVATGDVIEVPSVMLDQIRFDHPIDFIKIDIEGGETRALLGMLSTLKRHEPTLLIEYHSHMNLHDCTDILSAHYDVLHIPHPHNIVGHGWLLGKWKNDA